MKRQSNFELLRIFSMILIVSYHYSVHTTWTFPPGFHFDKYFIHILGFGGKLGVNLFVITSGYFLSASQFKWESIVKLLSRTWFYSIFICVFLYLFNIREVSIFEGLKSLSPFNYWFVTCYICILLISPFLNNLTNSLTYIGFLKFIFLFLIFIVIPFFDFVTGFFSLFLFLYLIGSFIRSYLDDFKVSNGSLCVIIAILFFTLLLSIALIDYLSMFTEKFNHPLYFAKSDSILVILLSVCVFVLFKQFPIRFNGFVNTISASTFGVYLIHDNFLFRKFLWDDFIKYNYFNMDGLYVGSLFYIFFVYISCTAIDYVFNRVAKVFNVDLISRKLVRLLNLKFKLI